MDAVEYLREKNRMCRKYGEFPRDCFECPIGNDSGECPDRDEKCYRCYKEYWLTEVE